MAAPSWARERAAETGHARAQLQTWGPELDSRHPKVPGGPDQGSWLVPCREQGWLQIWAGLFRVPGLPGRVTPQSTGRNSQGCSKPHPRGSLAGCKGSTLSSAQLSSAMLLIFRSSITGAFEQVLPGSGLAQRSSKVLLTLHCNNLAGPGRIPRPGNAPASASAHWRCAELLL